jgi:hypothetical protein
LGWIPIDKDSTFVRDFGIGLGQGDVVGQHGTGIDRKSKLMKLSSTNRESNVGVTFTTPENDPVEVEEVEGNLTTVLLD